MLSLTADPFPRSLSRTYAPHTWNSVEAISLPSAHGPLPQLDNVLASRRSTHRFSDLSLETLGHVLWLSSHCQRAKDSEFGFLLQQRPLPSAGGMHPIHIIVKMPRLEWARYNATAHALDVLSVPSSWSEAFAHRCNEVVPTGNGTLMLFVAEPGMTAAKYDNFESLVWRDAGVLQGDLAIIAAGLNCGFCLLGINGNPWAQQLCEQGHLTGVGVAVLGAQ